MIKHIVMWKLKDEAEGQPKKANAAEMKKRLEGLKSVIPEIRELELGFQMEPNDASYDVVLFSIFQDKSGLEKYQKHPEHLRIAGFVKAVVVDRKVVDYESF